MAFRSRVTRLIDKVPAPIANAIARSERLKAKLRPLVNRAVSSDETPVTVRAGGGKGLRMLIDPQVEKYYWTGGHEPHLQAALSARLRDGQTFWDVGAHVGFFTMQASRVLGPRGRVIAFEPMPDNQRRLARNIELNGLTNIEIIGEAVGDRPGDFLIYSRKGSSLMWTLDPATGASAARTVTVGTLDDYLATLPVPDLVKIDAEGLESAVLRGAQKLIARRSTSFLIEFMSDAEFERGRVAVDGYSLSYVGDNHWLATPPGAGARHEHAIT